jgi:hypothetical protein
MVDALVEWGTIIHAEGVEEALRRADRGAAEEAERDRVALLEAQGADANQAAQRIEFIRKL